MTSNVNAAPYTTGVRPVKAALNSNWATVKSELETLQSSILTLPTFTNEGRAVVALSSPGMVAITGSGAAAVRTLTGTANHISVTNGAGTSGNPTFDFPSAVVFASGQGSWAFDANTLALRDPSDTSKKVQFSIAAISSSNTRTWSWPDFDDTFVGRTGTQTLTNKTLTSPTISTSAQISSGATFSWDGGDVVLTPSPNKLTLTGGTLAIGSPSDASLLYIGDTISTGQLGAIKVAPTFSGSVTHVAGMFVEHQVGPSATVPELLGVSINGILVSNPAVVTEYDALRIADPSVFTGGGTISTSRAILVEGGISEFRGPIAGGRSGTSQLALRTTTGTGSGDVILFQRGINGATEMGRMGQGAGSVVAGLSLNTTSLQANFLQFGSSPPTGGGMQIEAGGVSTAGTGMSFTAGASGSGTNLVGGGITFAAGAGRGTATPPDIFAFTYIPVASGTGTQNIALSADMARGSVIVGNTGDHNAAIATTAVDGFLYLPSCAGTPTGVPTAVTGHIPFVYDSSNNRLYAYNGAWRSVAVA